MTRIDETRIHTLLQAMDRGEKIAQISGCIFPWGDFPARLDSDGQLCDCSDDFAALLTAGLGSIEYLHFPLQPEESSAWSRALQAAAWERSRLGIPILIHDECCHGHLAQDSTVFPLPPGMAASFDPELIERVFTAIGREVRARGGHQVFAPILDLGRDPRWGRQEETFGEDVFLVTRMAVAAVRGLQGGTDGVQAGHVAATAKHFAGYAQSMDGLQHGQAAISPRMLLDEILEPFRAAVQEADAAALMTSYGEIDGLPCTANRQLLSDILRDTWGFKGLVVADFGSIDQLEKRFGIAADPADAARLALRAGCDMDLPHGACVARLLDDEDPETEALLDRAVLRVLRLKEHLGLFSEPGPSADMASIVHAPEHQELARQAAERSLILLKNEADLLPLDRDSLQRVALIGPHSRFLQFGGASPHGRGCSIEAGLRDALPGDCELRWAQGCALTDRDEDHYAWLPTGSGADPARCAAPEDEAELIAEARDLADWAEVVICCLGESPEITGENWKPFKGGDRDELQLIGQQQELLDAVAATGTPVATVLIHGRSLAIAPVLERSTALLDAWNPGEARGQAVAAALLGACNPAGRLPASIPVSAGACPCHYSRISADGTRPYAFGRQGVVLPFGFGLSYSRFTISGLRLERDRIAPDENAVVLARIRNHGPLDGDEVIQVYLGRCQADIARPPLLLKAFARMSLAVDEEQELRISLPPERFRYSGIDLEPRHLTGRIPLLVGPRPGELQQVVVTIVDPA
ncbi:MAG: glycoside hydrolase family 3 N-terminal domain-containing protein [Planctomycetota bacterium]